MSLREQHDSMSTHHEEHSTRLPVPSHYRLRFPDAFGALNEYSQRIPCVGIGHINEKVPELVVSLVVLPEDEQHASTEQQGHVP